MNNGRAMLIKYCIISSKIMLYIITALGIVRAWFLLKNNDFITKDLKEIMFMTMVVILSLFYSLLYTMLSNNIKFGSILANNIGRIQNSLDEYKLELYTKTNIATCIIVNIWMGLILLFDRKLLYIEDSIGLLFFIFKILTVYLFTYVVKNLLIIFYEKIIEKI